MTIAFVLIAALMLLAALAFVVPPLLRGATDHSASEARRKLRALEQARADGILEEGEYTTKRAALGEALLLSVDAPSTRSPRSVRLALVLALILPAAAIVMYRFVGTPQALDPAALVRSDAAPEHGLDMDAAIAKLADKLKQNPNDAEGWTLLGRAQKSLQRFAEARDALKHAHELAPDDADITMEYAEALALASPEHRLAGEPRTLIDGVLKTQPQHQRALWLSGVAESQERRYDNAIDAWNKLLPKLPPDSDVAASIKRQIAQAQALRDGKPLPPDEDAAIATAASAAAPTAAAAAANDASASSGPHITVNVTLDPKLKDKVTPGDVLFVYAKAASGPPMPVAIARLTAAQLPATVTLTDGMGMMPSMKLSSFAQVIIGARISKSGNAIAQSGDLQTVSPPLPNSRSEPVQLTIDQVVP